jgi:cation/acetate symporter
MILILGFGTVAVVGVEHLKAIDPSGNLAAPLLAHALGGDFLTAFISAIAFATILAVVTGLVVTSTTSFAYDIYNHIFKKGDAKETEQLRVAKIAAIVIGVIAIALSLNLKQLNVTFLVSLTFSVAASIILPVLVLTLYWKRFNRYGVFCGMGAGMITSIVAVIFGPMLMSQPLFPLKNPGIVTIPIGFLGAIFGTFCFEKHEEDIPFQEFEILSQTGISVKKMVR